MSKILFTEAFLSSENELKKVGMIENYFVGNHKIKKAIQKDLPLSVQEGLLITFNSFKK